MGEERVFTKKDEFIKGNLGKAKDVLKIDAFLLTTKPNCSISLAIQTKLSICALLGKTNYLVRWVLFAFYMGRFIFIAAI